MAKNFSISGCPSVDDYVSKLKHPSERRQMPPLCSEYWELIDFFKKGHMIISETPVKLALLWVKFTIIREIFICKEISLSMGFLGAQW